MFLPLLSVLLLPILVISQQTYTNPLLYEDIPDIDVIRVNSTYYYSASTFHQSPGAPILQSKDLVNWEYIGHSVPVLDFDAPQRYNLESGSRAYVKGIWASTIGYRASTGTFYWLGCVDFARTYVYTAKAAAGPWSKSATIGTCYYDAGLLIDDDDKMYVAYGNTQLSVAELSSNGLSETRKQVVFNTPSDVGTLEGSRFYKRNGAYYIWVTRPANAQYVLKSTSGPFGPYTMREVIKNVPSPIGNSGWPHQGGLVTTPSGAWHYLAFIDSYPMGRTPVLAPVTWSSDGWPTIQLVNGAWGKSYSYPIPASPVASHTGVDKFSGTSLGHQWEWNHNPDTSKFIVNNGLVLRTATVTNDPYAARNTLTRRVIGPKSSATIKLTYSSMRPGDRAGLALWRDRSALIRVENNGGTYRLAMVNSVNLKSDWTTESTGSEIAGVNVSGGVIWLRAIIDVTPGTGRVGSFQYSTDGTTFRTLGNNLALNFNWQFFLGYRFAVFNHATQSLGGEVKIESFDLQLV